MTDAATAEGPKGADIPGVARPAIFHLTMGDGAGFYLYDNYLQYRDKSIAYRQITGISFHSTSAASSNYALPVLSSVRYRLHFTSLTDDTVIEYYPFEGMLPEQSQREKEEQLLQLYQRLHQLVKPYLVLNLLLHYWTTQSLSICNLVLSPKGITTRNVWGEANTVEWDRFLKSEIKDNAIYLNRREGDTGSSEFFFSSTDEINTFVLPDLLNYLQPANGVIDEAAKDRIVSRLTEMP